eukprot:6204777-Prymnesium_polylepis.1
MVVLMCRGCCVQCQEECNSRLLSGISSLEGEPWLVTVCGMHGVLAPPRTFDVWRAGAVRLARSVFVRLVLAFNKIKCSGCPRPCTSLYIRPGTWLLLALRIH